MLMVLSMVSKKKLLSIRLSVVELMIEESSIISS